jgi:UDP-N-acetylmuramate dehydrogenase
LRAADLIEQAGLKGTKVGGAEVSERHANYVIAQSGTSSDDVLRLIDLMQRQILDRVGVELELDIQIW